jgi:hypothetical protein
MKYFILLSTAIFLTACQNDTQNDTPSIKSNTGRTYYIECIDGVEYWRRTTGHLGFLAVRVDPVTLTFVKC